MKILTLKKLLKKFSWKILLILLLVFLSGYIAFLLRFNLLNNLSFNRQTKGYFHYLFGKYSLIEKIEDKRIFINWSQLLLFLFILYFPLKLTTELIVHYRQEKQIREIKKYLHNEKKIKEGESLNNYSNLNNSIEEFSSQFVNTLVGFFKNLIDIFFILINLTFIVKNYDLERIILFFLIIFAFLYLIWLIFFYGIISPLIKNNYYQNIINKIPYLTTAGASISFLFVYYHLQERNALNWGIYFVAYSLQLFLLKMNKIVKLLFSYPNLKSIWKEILTIN